MGLRWYYAAAAGFAVLFVIIGVSTGVQNYLKATGLDFISLWSAGRLALGGHASAAYDISLHHKLEQSVAPHVGLIPFPYPPPFLLIIAPFALPSFSIGLIMWMAATATFYAIASSRFAPLRFAFGNAPVCVNFQIGQTGFLICGIFILGVSLISSAPFIAGAILGLMILKPQLAMLLPVAMLAGREWRVIAGAIATSAATLTLGVLLFGLKTYWAFWEILPHYVAFIRDGRLAWYQLASPFALARFAGLPQAGALSIHFVIAALAAVLTARAWSLKLDQRVPILAASTMLISPYFFTYDSLLIIIPLGWLIRQERAPSVIAFIFGCSLIPIITSFTPWVAPNTMSLAAIASLCALHVKPSARLYRPDETSPAHAPAAR